MTAKATNESLTSLRSLMDRYADRLVQQIERDGDEGGVLRIDHADAWRTVRCGSWRAQQTN